MRCLHCGAEIPSPTAFCLHCNRKNAISSALFVENGFVIIYFIGKYQIERYRLKIYEDDASIRNLLQHVAEKLHERRLNEIWVSGVSKNKFRKFAQLLKLYALSPLTITFTDEFESANEFIDSLTKHLRAVESIKKVYIKPDEKIQGSHPTIIGEREGVKLLRKIAESEYVKKIVPGVIENKGTASGGVKLKLTRCDEKGNIRALLISGAAVQEIFIVTTAKDKREGEIILNMLQGLIQSE